MSTPVSYGAHVATDADLRLCGDVQGKRVIELGVADPPNSVSLAMAGAKVIAVDPDPAAIAHVRRLAEGAEVRVECHESDLADLGYVTSASVDLALVVHRLGEVDDLARLLRQVHRILKPQAPMVLATTHPAAAVETGPGGTPGRRYGDGSRTIGDLFMALQRSNFSVDVLHELDAVDRPDPLAPSVLVLRARKLGV